MMRWIIATLCLLSLATAHADTRLVYHGSDGKQVVSLRDGAIRIDTGDSGWQLYRRNSNTMFHVDPAQHSYSRIDAAMADRLRRHAQALKEEIEARLQAMPPADRRAARAALAEQLPAFADQAGPPELETTGATDTVAGIDCDIMTVKRGRQVTARLCVASAQSVGLSLAEYDTLTAMFGLMQRLSAGSGFGLAALPWSRLTGLPIRLQAVDGDRQRSLTTVSHPVFDSDLFGIPDDYTEKTPPLQPPD